MTYLTQVEQGFYPNSKDNVRNSLFEQYERILFESLITSFGLDAFIQDQHGGDVDTIHNVRQTIEKRIKRSVNRKKMDNLSMHTQENVFLAMLR